MRFFRGLVFVLTISSGLCLHAQEKSVKPGINDSFKDPNPKEYVDRFEVESREVFAKREAILAACEIKPGQVIADIGAGTGLFTLPFAEKTGKDGQVIAVDIAKNFLDHIKKRSTDAGLKNVETLQCPPDSTGLKPASIDAAFICDVYHHFEFPQKTMTSLFAAMKPGGRLMLIDFKRVEGKSTDFVMKHVRAGQEVFEAEIARTGFRKVKEVSGILAENYFLIFEKPAAN